MSPKGPSHNVEKKTGVSETSKPAVENSGVSTDFQIDSNIVLQKAESDPRSLSSRNVLQLQRMVGNQAVEQRLSRPMAPISLQKKGNGGVIQRQVLSKIEIEEPMNEEPRIGDVIIGGRTPSPFSDTMGAHSTAWIAHIDEVRRYLVNTDLSEGIKNLCDLADEALKSPLRTLEMHLDKSHQDKLKVASANLLAQKLIMSMEIAGGIQGKNAAALVQGLRGLIDRYLTYVNYLPMATVKGGDPNGHGEGSARGDLNLFEYVAAGVQDAGDDKFSAGFKDELKELSSKNFQGEIKAGANGKFKGDTTALKAELIDRLWALFAVETPGIFSQGKAVNLSEIWYMALQNFIKTIEHAYPYSFDFVEMHKVDNQLAGLDKALSYVKGAIDPDTLAKLKDKLRTEPLDEEAAIREDHNEVATSDFQQGGAGFQATVLLENNGIIGDVDLIGALEMIGRTESPFSGTMGAHTTAWIAHLDSVRRLLINKTLPQAMEALKTRALEAMQDPGVELSGKIDEKHQVKLIGAYNLLNTANGKVEATTKAGGVEQMAFLEDYIHCYLRFVNFLPLSTISVGRLPNGRSEGQHRNFLLNYEEYGPEALPGYEPAARRELLQEHLSGLFDQKALEDFPPLLGDREEIDFDEYFDEGFPKDHALFPYIQGAKSKMEDPAAKKQGAKVARDRFIKTMLEAYPRATKDSGILGTESSLATLSANTGSQAISPANKLKIEVFQKEKGQLNGLLTQNNCLINAIKRAALGGDAQATMEELLQIRLRIGEFGNMLYATPAIINIICEVLGITRGIVVVYQGGLPSEDFGNTDVNPIMIQHTGAAHFEPYTPPANAEPSAGKTSKNKRPPTGSSAPVQSEPPHKKHHTAGSKKGLSSKTGKH